MTTSLLTMQAGKTSHPDARVAIEEAATRVISIAAACRRVDDVDADGPAALEEMLEEIAEAVHLSAGTSDIVTLKLDLAPVMLPGQVAVYVGLIVNELLTNAYKHAFRDGKGGTVRLSCRQATGKVIVEVADDGRFAAGTARVGLGQALLGSLSKAIAASLELIPAAWGRHYRLTVPTRDAGAV
jgi:two-component sensor histidine kinase